MDFMREMSLADLAREEFILGGDVQVDASLLSKILRGEKYPVPGYDYSRIAALRPTRGQLNSRRAQPRES